MRLRTHVWWIAIIAIMAFVTGCASSGGDDKAEEGSVEVEGEPDPNGVLTVAVNFQNFLFQDKLDPALSKNACEFLMMDYVYGTLVDFDQDNMPIPSLAEKWEISDPSTITFTLRSGITFNDGTPLTADNVKASVEYIKAGFPAKNTITSLSKIASITVVNPTTVTFTTTGANADDVIYMMGGREGMIVHPTMIAGTATLPIGAGPMKVDSLTPGQELKLSRNESYYEPWQLGGMTFTNVDIGPASAQALKAGDVDMVTVDGQTSKSFTEDDFTVLRTPKNATLTYQNLTLRTDVAPLDNVDVRRAVNYAINKESILEGALGGIGTLTSQNFAEGTPWYVSALADTYAYDVAKAKSLLASAGVAPGTALNVVYPGNPTNTEQLNQFQIVKEDLEAVGFTVNAIPALDTNDILSKFWLDKSAHVFSAAIPGSPDPTEQLNAKFGTSFQANNTGNSRPEVLALVQAANTAYDDPAARDASIKEAVDFIVDQALEVPISWRPRNVVFNNQVLGGEIVAPSDVCDSIGLKDAYVIKQ